MKLIFATNNTHKLNEVREILGSDLSILSLKDVEFNEELREDFETMEENARQKAIVIHEKFKADCFADDSGLEIEALNNRPGVFSARYAGEPSNDQANMKKIVSELNGISNRKARFRTVISLFLNGKEFLFEGMINGKITTEAIGSKGFGYDPVFIPDGYTKTFAEIEPDQKNKISHRAEAVKKMSAFLKSRELS